MLVSPERAQRHPIVVMVDDHPRARPQSGFSGASVVWHAPAEGGVPRYMMIFGEGDPALVGPVRSARDYFVSWASEWRSVYVHVGGSPEALRTLAAKGRGELVYDADEFSYGGRYMFRSGARTAPHNAYTDGERPARPRRRSWGRRWAGRGRLDVRARRRAVSPAEGGPDRDLLHLQQDLATTMTPRRTRTPRTVSGASAQFDAATDERVAPKNVVIMFVEFAPLNDGHPELGRLEAEIIGSGSAWIATNGRTVRGTWRKDSETGPTRFFGPDGSPALLTVGQTFVQVLEAGTDVTIRDGAPPPTSPWPARPPGID